MKKNTVNNLITYGIVVVGYIIFTVMGATGNLSSSMKGYLVPMCIYIIMAVSLNLLLF